MLRLGLVVEMCRRSRVIAAAAAAVVVAARCCWVVRTGSRHCCVFEFQQQHRAATQRPNEEQLHPPHPDAMITASLPPTSPRKTGKINDPDAGIWMVGYGVPAVLVALIGLKPQVTETLPWRRVADLHVMISSAVIAMLGWALYKERVTQIFHQEEGREFSGLMLTAVWLLLCRHSGRGSVGMLRVSTAVAITVFPFVAWLYYHINKELRSNWPEHCKTAI
uniref:Transmembrane protein 220 n=1 Tax=Anabas testudineus TaxID=64144 RepID=A0AAQ6IU55_ANATE